MWWLFLEVQARAWGIFWFPAFDLCPVAKFVLNSNFDAYMNDNLQIDTHEDEDISIQDVIQDQFEGLYPWCFIISPKADSDPTELQTRDTQSQHS